MVEYSSEEKAKTTAVVAGKLIFCSGSVKNIFEAEVPVEDNAEEIEHSDVIVIEDLSCFLWHMETAKKVLEDIDKSENKFDVL